MPFWTFTPPADALAAKQKADAIKRALEAKAARKRAIANGEKFEGEDEDPDDWEECGDGRGGVYYHNLLTFILNFMILVIFSYILSEK